MYKDNLQRLKQTPYPICNMFNALNIIMNKINLTATINLKRNSIAN